MEPGKRVAVVAHCLLNQNTVVKPLASHVGAVEALVRALVERGYGVIQLPCPEATYLGMRRWWMSREQYDTASYREHSRRLLEPYVRLLEELSKDGCQFLLIGVRGSPSCAVESSTSNPAWGGEPNAARLPQSKKVGRPGVFMEELLRALQERGIGGVLAAFDVDHEEVARRGLGERELAALDEHAPRRK